MTLGGRAAPGATYDAQPAVSRVTRTADTWLVDSTIVVSALIAPPPAPVISCTNRSLYRFGASLPAIYLQASTWRRERPAASPVVRSVLPSLSCFRSFCRLRIVSYAMTARGNRFRNPVRADGKLRYVMIAAPNHLLIELVELRELERWRIPPRTLTNARRRGGLLCPTPRKDRDEAQH